MTREKTSGLVVIGGFPGSGKTTISRRLSLDLKLPRLDADVLGKTIRGLEFFSGGGEEAYKIGYAALWRLCDEFLGCRLTVVVDANMAYDVAWDSVDALSHRHSSCRIVPIVLQCPREVCLERARRRYVEEPGWHGDPERFNGDRATMVWDYLSDLSRPDVLFLDANRPLDDVYADVKEHVTASLIR